MGIISVGLGAAGGNGVVLFDSTLSGSAASIDSGAGGFPTSLNVLTIYFLARTDEAVVASSIVFRLNNDSGANYDRQYCRGQQATASAAQSLGATEWVINQPGASAPASMFGLWRFTFPAYGQTTAFKVGEGATGFMSTVAADARIDQRCVQWRNTAAINRVAMSVAGANFVAGSRLLIVGAN